MRLTKCVCLIVALCLGWGVLAALANDVRSGNDQPLPSAKETLQDGAQVIPNIGGAVQVQSQIIVGNAQVDFAGGARATGVAIDANGVKTFQTEEYGKKTKIIDDPKNGIKIECTSKKGGTDETKKYDAKDVADLETKHPQEFKLYQRYLGNQAGAGVTIQGGTVQLVLGQPAMPVPFPMPGGGGAGQVVQGQTVMGGPAGGVMPIEIAKERMSQLSKDIQSATKNGSWKDASKESKAAIKKQAAKLKRQLGDLEKQFEE